MKSFFLIFILCLMMWTTWSKSIVSVKMLSEDSTTKLSATVNNYIINVMQETTLVVCDIRYTVSILQGYTQVHQQYNAVIHLCEKEK